VNEKYRIDCGEMKDRLREKDNDSQVWGLVLKRGDYKFL